EERPQALQDRNLDVDQGKQFFLVERRDEVWISRRRDGRLRRPEVDHLVQVHAEADDDPEDEQEQEERGLEVREAKPLRENRTEYEGEDTHEGEDREDDPDDAAAQVPAIQPLGGADLLTFGGHAHSPNLHGSRTDITGARGANQKQRTPGKRKERGPLSSGPRAGRGESLSDGHRQVDALESCRPVDGRKDGG